MPLWPWVMVSKSADTQTYEVPLPLITVAGADVPLTWVYPFVDATYSVAPGVEGGSAILGKLSATLKDASRTPTGCTITLTNTGLVSIAAGARLHVVAAGKIAP